EPPNLNALYNVNGIKFKKLYLQIVSGYATFECTGPCEQQSFVLRYSAMDFWEISRGALEDRHGFDVVTTCNLGPGASDCRTEGKWRAAFIYNFGPGKITHPQLGEQDHWKDIIETKKNGTMWKTDCGGNGSTVIFSEDELVQYLAQVAEKQLTF